MLLPVYNAHAAYISELIKNDEDTQIVLAEIEREASHGEGLLRWKAPHKPLSGHTIRILKQLGYSIIEEEEQIEGEPYKYKCIVWETDTPLTYTDFLMMEQSSLQQKKLDKINKKTIVIIVLCIIIILLLLLRMGFLLIQTKQTGLVALIDHPPVSSEIPDWDPDVVTPPEDSGIQMLNKKLELDAMCVNMRGEITLADTYSAGYFNIVNDEGNNYPQFVTITKDGNGIEIYKSGLIPVGKGIMYATLDVEVPAGVHECTALFTQVDTNTNKICGQAAAKIVITVKE